jgi:hypothetical protein
VHVTAHVGDDLVLTIFVASTRPCPATMTWPGTGEFAWASWRGGSAAFRDWKDRVGDEAVRLAVDRDRGVGIWSLDKAKILPCSTQYRL